MSYFPLNEFMDSINTQTIGGTKTFYSIVHNSPYTGYRVVDMSSGDVSALSNDYSIIFTGSITGTPKYILPPVTTGRVFRFGNCASGYISICAYGTYIPGGVESINGGSAYSIASSSCYTLIGSLTGWKIFYDNTQYG